MDRFDEIAKQALGGAGCTCHEAYVGRNLTDPQCVWHDNAEDVAAALRRVHNEAIDTAMATVRGITLTSIEPPMSQEAAFETCRQIVLGVVGSLRVTP